MGAVTTAGAVIVGCAGGVTSTVEVAGGGLWVTHAASVTRGSRLNTDRMRGMSPCGVRKCTNRLNH
jgi:hypothetical protein